MVPEMIGARIEIGRKTCYFLRHERRFEGNLMVPEMIGSRIEIARKTCYSSETSGVLEEI